WPFTSHCCCFSGYSEPYDLHSFPTRRSSDLRLAAVIGLVEPRSLENDAGAGAEESPQLFLAALGALRQHRLGHRLEFIEGVSTRSEEHTSELQSPYDIVCRLLLEKKKKREHD